MLVVIAAGILAPTLLSAKSQKGGKEAEEKKAAHENQGVNPLDVPIPINHEATGVRIPNRDGKGRLQMFFNVDTVFRVDDTHLRMTALKIETYDDAGKPEMHIDMPISFLDLKTNIISSKDPVTIRRSDFELTGSHMTFDTKTRIGKFSGPVRMLIFNHDDLSQKPAPEPTAAASISKNE